jgi:hypothetical protein
MRAQRLCALLVLVLGFAAFILVAYGWRVTSDATPVLEKAGAFGDPRFPYRTLAEWQSAVWVRLGSWLALGALLISSGVGLWVSHTRRWGWPLSLVSAALLVVLYAFVLIARPLLWDEFLGALGVSVGVLAFYREWRKRKDAF